MLNENDQQLDSTIQSAEPRQMKSDNLNVMNFLNEIAIDYPDALSFASGRPAEQFFQLQQWLTYIPLFIEYFSEQKQVSQLQAYNLTAQYGRTNGLINELISKQLKQDEEIYCHATNIVITAGCQEAIALCVKTLFQTENDILLVCNPTYIGISGMAEIDGVKLDYIDASRPEIVAELLQLKINELSKRGRQIRAFYLIPDFDNPTGNVISAKVRRAIIDICANNDIYILEDNPYGMYRYEGQHLPRLYSLDHKGCVIYLGTYSKTLCPSLRIGFMLLPTDASNNSTSLQSTNCNLLETFSTTKSFITVNTSQISQAIVGGILINENFSLVNLIEPSLHFYASNRDTMLSALERELADYKDQISWNKPAGGFFMTINLPFVFGKEEAEICARQYQVLVMPLCFFALDNQHDNRVRLAFSNLQADKIDIGIARFAKFIKSKMVIQIGV